MKPNFSTSKCLGLLILALVPLSLTAQTKASFKQQSKGFIYKDKNAALEQRVEDSIYNYHNIVISKKSLRNILLISPYYFIFRTV